MTDQPNQEEKKIIVDEDWKSQMDAEREAARQQPEAQPAADADGAAPEGEFPLPEPSLTFLFGGLYLQGMVALGLMPNPATNASEKNLRMARHTIDTLDMLRQKTEGNRTPQETQELDAILHEPHMAFVTVETKS